MYMKSKRLDIEQNKLNVNPKKLSSWLNDVESLISQHGQDMVLYIKNNTRSVSFFISKDFDILMNIEQEIIEENCSMTLKQWKESINKLIRKFGSDFYLYLSEETESEFFLSPMED